MRSLPAVTACLLALVPLSAPGQDATVRPQTADCWVEHSQVQPSRQDLGAAPDPKSRLAGDRHAGAEHLPRIARLPPCSAEAPRAGAPPPKTGAGVDPAMLRKP